MKLHPVLLATTLLVALLLVACGNDSQATRDAARDSIETQSALEQPNPTADVPGQEPAQNAAGVWHYTCSNGCAGGAGSAVPCPTCGNMLAHNQAYHDAPQPSSVEVAPSFEAPATPPPPAPTAEPAQNAAGVWHYTCSKGCPGGAGSPVPCSKCGTTLAHNAAYHQ